MSLPKDLNTVIQKLTAGGYHISTVYDIGANKGTWTTKYEAVIKTAQFLLFEANPRHNRPTGLKTKHKWFNVVLSNPETSEVIFNMSQNNLPGTGDSYYKEQTHVYDNCKTVTLKTTTLDELASQQKLPFPQLIKLDTQGSELDILRGGSSIVANADIIVTEMPILPYNKGAPVFNDYINFFNGIGFVPVGVEGIIFANNVLAQIDIVFLRREINIKYYGDNKLFIDDFNIQK